MRPMKLPLPPPVSRCASGWADLRACGCPSPGQVLEEQVGQPGGQVHGTGEGQSTAGVQVRAGEGNLHKEHVDPAGCWGITHEPNQIGVMVISRCLQASHTHWWGFREGIYPKLKADRATPKPWLTSYGLQVKTYEISSYLSRVCSVTSGLITEIKQALSCWAKETSMIMTMMTV